MGVFRMFIVFENKRFDIDVLEGETVGEVKSRVKKMFRIQDNDQLEQRLMTFTYAKSDLQDNWIFSDLAIVPGSTIHVGEKDEVKPVLYVSRAFNHDTIPILEQLQIPSTLVSEIRTIVAKKSGIPVSVFRLMTADGQEMFDQHDLLYYAVNHGDTLLMETWDGWNDFLNLASLGFTAHVMKQLSDNEAVARFQMKVAMYMAAHFGHTELASTLMKQGMRPEEPIGEHPFRQWCPTDSHIETLRAPVHEATECGQLNVLRTFVNGNICVIVQRDGYGLMPLNIALRKKIRHCAGFLIGKQWSRITLKDGSKTIPLTIFHKMVSWGERAREKALVVHGHHHSTLKRKAFTKNALAGNGCEVDGYLTSRLRSDETPLREIEEKERSTRFRPETPDIFEDDPESYFKTLTAQANVGGIFMQARQSKPKLNMGNLLKKSLLKPKAPPPPPPESVASQAKPEDDASQRESSSKTKRTEGTPAEGEKKPGFGGFGAKGGWLGAMKMAEEENDADEELQQRKNKKKLPPLPRRKAWKQRAQSFSKNQNQKLPDINKGNKVSQSHQNLRTGAENDSSSDLTVSKLEDTKSKGFLLQTPKTANTKAGLEDDKQTEASSPREKRNKRERSIKSAVRLAKARSADGSIPLPIHSVDPSPRPFYHVGHVGDVIQQTREEFERIRGISARENAISTLSRAQSFKEKPWLGQMRQALSMSQHGVRRVLLSSGSGSSTMRNRMSRAGVSAAASIR